MVDIQIRIDIRFMVLRKFKFEDSRDQLTKEVTFRIRRTVSIAMLAFAYQQQSLPLTLVVMHLELQYKLQQRGCESRLAESTAARS